MRSGARMAVALRPAVALTGAAVVCLAFAAGRSAGPAGQVGPASRPATSTAPAPDLSGAANAAAAAMLARLDGSFRAVVHAPFVVIGNLPQQDMAQLMEGSVLGPARAMWTCYFRRRPTDVITILLFRDGESYKHWAKQLFNDTSVPYFGYCKTAQRTLVMNIATGTGTLVHELTHALLAYDFPAVPDWFNEGLASLHEQCYVRPDGIVGAVNWRLPHLQKAVAAKQLRPLRELVSQDGFYGAQQGLNYAQARYFVMYVQQRGLLGKFYEHFRDHRTGPDAAVKSIEHVLGESLEKVEAEFLRWVGTLRWPQR